MFSFIGLRLAPRLIPPALSTTLPTFSRALFVSHFQTRSFLTTPRLAQATAATVARAARRTSVKSKSKEKPAAKNRVTAKKPSVKKKTLVQKPPIKNKKSKKGPVIVPRTTPPIPKHAASPYLLFYTEQLANYPPTPEKQHMIERCVEIAAAWRNLAENEKQKYMQESAANREQRNKERLDWFNTIDPKILKEINKRRKTKGKKALKPPRDSNAPRHVMNSFLFFLDEFKKSEQAAGLSLQEAAKASGQRWREMSSSQKQVYQDKRQEALAARGQ